jgi:putative endonuclease
MSFQVYIIYSASLDRFNVGYTSDEINSRLHKHNANHKEFTGKGSDWILRYIDPFATKAEAMRREKEIKSWKIRQKIESFLSVRIRVSQFVSGSFLF